MVQHTTRRGKIERKRKLRNAAIRAAGKRNYKGFAELEATEEEISWALSVIKQGSKDNDNTYPDIVHVVTEIKNPEPVVQYKDKKQSKNMKKEPENKVEIKPVETVDNKSETTQV